MPSTRSLNDPVHVAQCRRPIVRHVQCRSCGYEPDRGPAPACCPKCRGGCWETFVQAGKLRPAHAASADAFDGLTADDAPRDATGDATTTVR